MNVTRIPLRRHNDERGWFVELMRLSDLPKPVRQSNLVFSRKGVIRALHYHERGQDDFFACVHGMVRVVVLDRESGETFCEDIGDDNPVALYIPGTQLLVVSAKYAAPELLRQKLAKKDYRDIYIDLSSASIPATKLLVMDTFADGLFARPGADTPADSIERAGTQSTFDGNWKKAKQSEAEYMKAFDDAEAAYARALLILIAALKPAGTLH